MAYTPQTDDPLASYDKVPSLFGKGTAVGHVVTGTIVRPLGLVQDVYYGTTNPKFWDEAKTQPVMKVVVTLDVGGGELRSIWAQKPSAMFRALQSAQQAAGAGPMAVGGTLEVQYTGDEKNKNPAYNDAKQYRARYTPPAPVDQFADEFAPQPVQVTPTGSRSTPTPTKATW